MPANTWPNPFDVETNYLTTKDGNVERHVVEMDERYWRLHPDSTPLTVIMGRANKDATTQPEFKWREENPGPMWDQTSAAVTNVATTVPVDHGVYFKPGDQLRNARTGEVLRVTAVVADNLTVIRDWPTGVTGVAMDIDDWLLRLGPAYKEGSSLPDPRIVVEEVKSGFTQIFRRTYGVTGTEAATKQYGGPQIAKQRVSQGIDFRTELEYAAIFGKAGETFLSGDVIRQTGGIVDYIDTNSIALGGATSGDAVTWNKLEAAFEQGFEFGSTQKILVVGRRLASIISEISVNKIQTHVGEDTFGIHISRLTSTHGTVDVVAHPLLKNDYARTGFLLDMNHFYMRPLVGNGVNRDVKMLTNRQVTGDDKVIEEYFAELGFCLKMEKTHALISAAGDFVS